MQCNLKAPYELLSRKYRVACHQLEINMIEALRSILEMKNNPQKSKRLSDIKEDLQDIKGKLLKRQGQLNTIYDTCRKRVKSDHISPQPNGTLQRCNQHQHSSQSKQHNIIELKQPLKLEVKLEGQDDQQSSNDSDSVQFALDVVQHCSFMNNTAAAKKIAIEHAVEDLTMIEIELYEEMHSIGINIKNNELKPLENWIKENHHIIQKLSTTLQFELICCKYLSLLEKQKVVQAVNYLKQNVAKTQLQNCQKEYLQKLTIMLLQYDPKQLPYCLERCRSRFVELAMQIYGLETNFSELERRLKIGICTLKTVCCEKRKNIKVCPICDPKMSELGAHLPILTQSSSSLICRINSSLIDDSENYALALPSGQIYSYSGLEETSIGNKYYCVHTRTFYEKDQCKKVYLT